MSFPVPFPRRNAEQFRRRSVIHALGSTLTSRERNADGFRINGVENSGPTFVIVLLSSEMARSATNSSCTVAPVPNAIDVRARSSRRNRPPCLGAEFPICQNTLHALARLSSITALPVHAVNAPALSRRRGRRAHGVNGRQAGICAQSRCTRLAQRGLGCGQAMREV